MKKGTKKYLLKLLKQRKKSLKVAINNNLKAMRKCHNDFMRFHSLAIDRNEKEITLINKIEAELILDVD